jgi:hypothetical protein
LGGSTSARPERRTAFSSLWVPGAAGPQDEFVQRLHAAIRRFAAAEEVDEAAVHVEFLDGSRFAVHSIAAEPGFGFVTIRPHREDRADAPGELIVPVGSIKRIELDRAEEERARLGFALPEEG